LCLSYVRYGDAEDGMASTDDLPPDRYLTEQDLLEEYLVVREERLSGDF